MDVKLVLRKFKYGIFLLLLIGSVDSNGQDFLSKHQASFKSPPMDCWPHTRWWWPRNATTKENITYELEQMRSHGVRGVEQITMGRFYKKGNIDYLSDKYLELIKHAVKEAKRLEMEVSFNFGGPGWIIGGEWVAEEDRSKDMIPTMVEVSGGRSIDISLPENLIKTERSYEIYEPKLSGDEKLLAVVAGKVDDGVIDPNSLTVLTDRVNERRLKWEVPNGDWKIMCFWLAIDNSDQTVNHFDAEAMQRHCDFLGDKFINAVGDEFGKTVESFFCDSFELPYLSSGIKWSDGLIQKFKTKKNYDITKYLPAIWWEVENTSEKIRYDVNDFLSEVGYETFFKTFLDWCKDNGVKGRIQAYGFETDVIEGSGMTDIPEMEITAGEKDQHEWFDTRIGPKKYVASGAHIYGKNIVSVEANTFLHWERYRATLEEIKIASDVFLKSGANKFYTHGYSASPERDIAPSRTMGWATHANPNNIWWKYYPLLTTYIARCSYLLRQGDFAPDIAIYSPLANQWTKDALNARRWTRDFEWGGLGKLIMSNGYDFDLLNDDAIQNLAEFGNGTIDIRNLQYKVLLLPNISALPIKTLKKIEEYVQGGGTVIALDRIPELSTGLIDANQNTAQVKRIISKMYDGLDGKQINANPYGKGNVHYLKKVIHRPIWWDQYGSSFDPFLKILKKYIAPDFGLDLNHEGVRRNNGLSFYHRKDGGSDVYFVTNVQDKAISMPVDFRVQNRNIYNWNPYNGEVTRLFQYSESETGTNVPVKLEPWESTIIVFEGEAAGAYVSKTNFDEIIEVSDKEIIAEVSNNGAYYVNVSKGSKEYLTTQKVSEIPAPFIINGNWKMVLESPNFSKMEKEMGHLSSWIKDKETKNFSGTGKYTIQFDLSDEYISSDLKLELDLGKLGNVGDVKINGKDAGIIWMKGQKCEISNLVKRGENELIVYVTNTNINRVSAFKENLPVPDHLVEQFGKAKSDKPSREYGFEPLPPSGLMGPVKISPVKIVRVNY